MLFGVLCVVAVGVRYGGWSWVRRLDKQRPCNSNVCGCPTCVRLSNACVRLVSGHGRR